MDNDNYSHKIKNSIYHNNEKEMIELLNSGLNPNYEGGWPIRFAARHGAYSIVKILIQYGANPHLLEESGASTLQLAVYSGQHWHTDKWLFLLSYCDSSQLADGAAVAIIFNNVDAFISILKTGRCNPNIPTTLTGKTVEQLAKSYKLDYLINTCTQNQNEDVNVISTPTTCRVNRSSTRSPNSSHSAHRNLSPSVARFFNQTASQPSLTPPRNLILLNSSPTNYDRRQLLS